MPCTFSAGAYHGRRGLQIDRALDADNFVVATAQSSGGTLSIGALIDDIAICATGGTATRHRGAAWHGGGRALLSDRQSRPDLRHMPHERPGRPEVHA